MDRNISSLYRWLRGRANMPLPTRRTLLKKRRRLPRLEYFTKGNTDTVCTAAHHPSSALLSHSPGISLGTFASPISAGW